MDLALALGQPPALLKHAMTERELSRWIGYVRKRQLPSFRIELYLAKLTMIIAQTMGGAKDAALEDFILDFDSRAEREDSDDDDDIDVDEVQRAFGFRPRVRNDGT